MIASLARRDRIEVIAARIRKAESRIVDIEASEMLKVCPNLARTIIANSKVRIARLKRELARI